MAKKAGAQKSVKARPKEKLTNKEQSERFKQTARELGVDETGKEFEAALEKIIPRGRRQNEA